MRTLELAKGKISLYESAKEMPTDLYTTYQKYLIQAAGIGSDMESVSRHYDTLYKFLGAGMTAEAAIETQNLYQSIFLTLNEININHVCFQCWVHSINDVPVGDYSENAMIAQSKRLGKMGLTHGHVIDFLDFVKKK